MIKNKYYKYLLTIALILFISGKTLAQTSDLRVGVAEVEITPPIGYEQYRGVSTGVHDPLFAKAIVFEEGDEKAALVVCDIISITRDLSIEVRSMVSDQTGIPYSNIIVAATHTHTGPRHHAGINEYISKKRSDELSVSDEDSYEAFLLNGIVQAIVQASNNIKSLVIESGSGYAEGISFNRRFFMKDGRVGWNPGIGNPSIIRPAGPIDPEVGILLFRSASDNRPIASLINFANHTDTFGGTEFSADYPGYLANAIKEDLGEDFISIFGMGTSGDINHINVNSEDNHQKGQTVTKPTGEKLAAVVMEELPSLNKAENPILAVRSEFVYAPLQDYTEEELRWAQKEVRGAFYNERTFLQGMRARKIRSLENMRSSGEAIPPTVGSGKWTLPVEVQVFQIGDNTAIVGLPGEVFVELGMAIKEASPFENTLVIELTNIGIAYVPTEKAFAQGEYETVNSRLAPGGGELMVESAVRMLNDLHNDMIR